MQLYCPAHPIALVHQSRQEKSVPERAHERLQAVAGGGGSVVLAESLDGILLPRPDGGEVGGAVRVVRARIRH